MKLSHPKPVMSAGAIWTYCCLTPNRTIAEAFIKTLAPEKWKE